MSAKVTSLVWSYYNPQRCGAPLITALALADEANDDGGGIFQSVPTLAEKTRQSVRAVRMQLRRLEARKVLECVQKSTGGVGRFSQYRVDLGTLLIPQNPAFSDTETRHQMPGLPFPNPAPDAGFLGPHIEGLKEKNVRDGANPAFDDTALSGKQEAKADAEDERLARWMLAKLRVLNPKHREPSWLTWLRDLRLMREQDGHDRKAIAALFAWANADPFWRGNILSPAKLREKWDQLEIQRRSKGGAHPSGLPGDGAEADWRCVGLIAGERCTAQGTWQDPKGRAWCLGCRETKERDAPAAAIHDHGADA